VGPDSIDLWVEEGWLVPRGAIGDWKFSEIDLARTQLIQDLTGGLGVNNEGVPIILGLVDQLHGLRGALRDLLVALGTQPTSTRERLAAELRAVRLEPDGYASPPPRDG